MNPARWTALLSGLAISWWMAVTAPEVGAGEIDFDYGRDIQPLLAEHCYACHGPDAKTRKAGLRFDLRKVAVGELESGQHAIVPGDSAASEMVRRIFSEDPDEMMPPPDFRKRPSPEAKVLLKKWVEAGAEFSRHWAFEPVVKPKPPQVGDLSWSRNAIDRFVLARLETKGMKPSSEASRETLARRLSLDLRGLPPSLEEVEAASRAIAETGYDGIVDTMLGSKHYGERMAQDWLDLARYGDTNGYHNDSVRDMWLYRDYVIDAFNRNKPYDEFIIENMAGDLLPNADETTRVASGFNRCVTFNEEGGADPDEFYVTYAVDRANTAGQVFLGLTVGCAQCHDHKYDPISQKEFYQLYAFFNSVEGEIGAGGQSGYHNKPLPPLLKVRTPAIKKQIADLKVKITEAQAARAAAMKKARFSNPDGPLGKAARDWAAALAGPRASDELDVKRGLQLHLDAATVKLAEGRIKEWNDLSGNKHRAHATGKPKWIAEGINGQPSIRLDGKNDFLRTSAGAEKLGGDFTMVIVLRFHGLGGNQMPLMWGDESNGKRRALWKTDKNELAFNGYNSDLRSTVKFELNQPAIVILTQEGEENSTRFSLNGKESGNGSVGLSPFANKAITIGANNAGKENASAEFAEVLVYDRALTAVEVASVGRHLGSKYKIETSYEEAPAEILTIAAKPESERADEEREKLFQHFIHHVYPESRELFRKLFDEWTRLQEEKSKAEKVLPTTMVMVEMKKRKPAHVLLRGDFQQPGEEVQPDVPAIFPRLPEGQPRNRLGLAHWLTDPEHPLVARVTVNRIWKQLFGTGLVKTMGDFGTQGERPSHPELLDWLAADFVEHGWDVKRLQKLIVQSATYRQSSVNHRRYDDRDPENRLLSRAPRFRLSAEEVRDSVLAISGFLNRRVGGRSVFPYQPSNYLSSIGKGWKESSGDDLYRRGLYTFWRRTMLYPTFQIFDAPSREFCAVNRPRTNTPLQALATLNDPAFVEAARKFGERILAQGGASDEARLIFAFTLATSRRPNAAELEVLQEMLDEQKLIFANRTEDAKKLIKNGKSAPDEKLDPAELAAWMAVGNIILNLDETITRE